MRLLLLFSITLLFSCEEKINTVSEISFSSGTCYGECPEMSLEFNADGSVYYHGGKFADPKGNRKAVLTEKQWAELDSEAIKLLELYDSDSIVNENAKDDYYIDLYIKSKNRELRISGYSLFYPKSTYKLMQKMDAVKKTLTYKKSSEHTFSTKIK